MRCSGACDNEESSGEKKKKKKTGCVRLSQPATLSLYAHICPPVSQSPTVFDIHLEKKEAHDPELAAL